MDSLRNEGIRQLILDLRGNPGGTLDQGIQITDYFLESGQMVVETRGRALQKLEGFNSKIGYPDEWRDYAALEIGTSSKPSMWYVWPGAFEV